MSTDEKTILEYRLPARMREMKLFIDLEKIQSELGSGNCELHVKAERLVVNGTALLHAAADSSVVIGRALLGFLGIGYDKKTNSLKQITKREITDLDMATIGLSALDPAIALKSLSVPEADCHRLLILCILTGNRVSAHFTVENANNLNASLSDLALAQKIIIELINNEVYVKKSMGLPVLI